MCECSRNDYCKSGGSKHRIVEFEHADSLASTYVSYLSTLSW